MTRCTDFDSRCRCSGGTRGKLCHPPGVTATCIPGCQQSARDRWCDAASARDAWCDGLPWHLEDMGLAVSMDVHHDGYNEGVVDAEFWNAQLPHSIDALIATPNDPHADAMYHKFLSTYHITEADVPLVIFDKARTDSPFQLFGTAANVDPSLRLNYRVNGVPTKWDGRAG